MKLKDMALMGLGAGAVLMYQKYNEPVMKQMEKVMNKTIKKADKQLENMMQRKARDGFFLFEKFLNIVGLGEMC